ncbi:MAG: DNA polymerase III subunit alpha, partial [Oscillospiraceae bacterium]|nr:DNA polymerase III subunit alpha [Oscillospiraceae bacterium]
ELADQVLVLDRVARLSQATGIGLVATNDVHYIKKEDARAQAVMICIQTAKLLEDGNPIGFETDEFYLKSTEEMDDLFGAYEGALENTAKIAERCNVDFNFSETFLPEYAPPDKMSPETYLTELSYAGFSRLCPETKDQNAYKVRLDYELNIIISMGYAAYYLIVWDFINFAKKEGIPIGPGRGSGAGSLVAYFLGITGIDPIKYNLLFERFLNPERVSMPDFDIDICQDRRGEVVEYVKNKYGEANTAHIITFTTLASKQAIKDVGRVLNMSISEVDAIAKLIPQAQNKNWPLKKALEEVKELNVRYNSDDRVKNLIDTAIKLEGMPRNSSIHAAGLVITNNPVYEYVPLALCTGERVTQFDMNTVAALGLLKIDLLGLRYLTIIENAVKYIQRSEKNKGFDIEKIDLADEEIYKLYSSGNNDGIFQFEANWVKGLMSSAKPEYFEDIAVLNALIRPGPMALIPLYLKNRQNTDQITYETPKLKEILEVTYGCIIYQEQVMQILRSLAGYSYGRADIVRRAMSHKDQAVMAEERDIFLAGCEKNGIGKEAATKIFDIIAEFANYGFNKSHAVAYALLSYRTAYLKCYHKEEYLCALMTSVLNKTEKLSAYAAECSRLGIKIFPPDINLSESDFTIDPLDAGIRYGLLAIKNVGAGFLKNILFERETNGKFGSFADFLFRMTPYEQLNKRQVEALIKCGVFDSLGIFRSKLLAKYENIIDSLLSEKKSNIEGQVDMFSFGETLPKLDNSAIIYPDIAECELSELLAMEKEAAGRFFSGHPLDSYMDAIKNLNSLSISSVIEFFEDEGESGEEGEGDGGQKNNREEKLVTVAGIIGEANIKRTKNGDTMAFLTLEDEYASIEVVVFPKKYNQYIEQIRPDTVIAVQGNIAPGREDSPKIFLNNIINLKKNGEGAIGVPAQSGVLYIKVPDASGELYKKAINLAEIFEGKTELRIYDEQTKKICSRKNPGIEPDPALTSELTELLGIENVKLVRK